MNECSKVSFLLDRRDLTIKVQQRVLRISAILSPSMISVTGPSEELRSFRAWIGSEVTVKFANVNAWYHGGDQLEDIANEIMEDIDKRQVGFPSTYALQMQLRSSHDGSFANEEESSHSGLARWVVQHMLIYPFDWPKTSEAIVSTLAPTIVSQDDFRPQVLSFGPNSDWLLGAFKYQNLYPKLDMMEMSAFQASKTVETSLDHEESIAIVGMATRYPKGHGQEELWDTLYNGAVAVSEVSQTSAAKMLCLASHFHQIPASRFDASVYHDRDDSGRCRSMAAHHGAFIDDLWKFDNEFFNITPREAKSMDPQQRILLHTAQVALDDAGYVRDSTPTFQRATMGCYVGIATEDYKDNL